MRLAGKTFKPRHLRQRLGLNQQEFWSAVGVTQSGGASGHGVLFKVSQESGGRGWHESVLYNFNGTPDGNWPVGLTPGGTPALRSRCFLGGGWAQ